MAACDSGLSDPSLLLHSAPWAQLQCAGFLSTAWLAPLCPGVLALAVSSIPLLGLFLYIIQVSVLMSPYQDIVPDHLLPVNSPSPPQLSLPISSPFSMAHD